MASYSDELRELAKLLYINFDNANYVALRLVFLAEALDRESMGKESKLLEELPAQILTTLERIEKTLEYTASAVIQLR